MILPIYTYGQPVLRKEAQDITPDYPELKKFIEDSVRFYNCQFIISTHSPFLLKLMDAKIYDLDEVPVKTKKWTELSNVLVYYNFFKEYEDEFNKK